MLKIQNPSFEPGGQSKRLWMYVRKRPYQVGQQDPLKCPGLFQVASPEVDIILLATAIVLEIWGLFMIVSLGSLPYENILVIVFAAVAIDLVLAIVHHIPTRAICESENEKAAAGLYDPGDPRRHEQLCDSRISKAKKWRQRPLAIAIFFVAAVKIYAYFDLRGQFNIFTIAVLTSYIVVAYIHTMHTGYALSLMASWMSFKRDFSRFLNKDARFTVVAHRTYFIGGQEPERLVKVSLPVRGETSLVVEKEIAAKGEKMTNVSKVDARLEVPVLYSWGVLTDKNLLTLAEAQPEDVAKKKLARSCIYHQLDILRAPAPAGEAATAPGRPPGGTIGVCEYWGKVVSVGGEGT